MPDFEFQQVFEKVVQNLDASDASQDPCTVPSVQDTTKLQCEEHLRKPLPSYEPPIDTEYRPWSLRDPAHQQLSAVQLFLLFFQPILDLPL